MIRLGDLKELFQPKGFHDLSLCVSSTFIIQMVAARSSYSSCPHLFTGFIFLKQLTELKREETP